MPHRWLNVTPDPLSELGLSALLKELQQLEWRLPSIANGEPPLPEPANKSELVFALLNEMK